MPYGVCKVCGCTDNDPCHNPAHGNCWWVDDSHELCSHCADKTIADDPATQHCINSKGFDTQLISLPNRYMHTPIEVVDVRDIQWIGELIAACIAEPCKEVYTC